MAEQEVLHRQSREAWEKRSADMEAGNNRYLIRLTELLAEKITLELALKDERNDALLAGAELRRENRYLRAKNLQNRPRRL